MKILHTSDWHLGQSFFGKTRKNEHQQFLDWLLSKVREEQVNAIIVAGDVFDTGTPPSYARELYSQFIADLLPLNCSLVVLGGNHDSVAMLNEAKPLIHKFNSYVVASTDLPQEEQLIKLTNTKNEVAALICAVPFIRVRDVLQSQAGESIEQKNTNLEEAIKQHYHQLYAYALNYKQRYQLAVPIIMTGHLAALGVSLSESVRDTYIGNLSGFPVSGFPPADYIALGHIHRPQIVGKEEHIRYSGSPIPLSFDELGVAKQVILLEFAQDKLQEIRPIEIPLFQPMQIISGEINEIQEQLRVLEQDPEGTTVWLQLQVQETSYLSDLQQSIQNLTQDLNVEVLRLKRERILESTTFNSNSNETLDEFTPLEVFAQCLSQNPIHDENGELDTAREQRLHEIYAEVLEEIEHAQTTEAE